MSAKLGKVAIALALVLSLSTLAYAQGGATSSLSGIVVDSGGGVIPGATVSVKNNATGTTTEVVTNDRGIFSVPALEVGTYTVTVTLQGFKTAVISNVLVAAASPADVKAVLEVGALEETVIVQGQSELVQTQTATVSSTMTVDQIQALPLPTRNAVNFATLLPGVNTTGTNRDSNFNGLPDSAVAIVLDGVNNNENFNKSTEGLFAMVTPRQDAVEAVTVTSAAGGAESGGHGAVQIRFVTRSGSDKFQGSAYEYYRSPKLNTNYYFNEIRNLPKNDVTLNQYGARVGGPIVLPGVYNGRGKAFFFLNYEELKLPNDFSRTRNVLHPDTQSGIFRYTTTVDGQQVTLTKNLWDLARANNQLATPDPTVMSLLNGIREATQKTGGIRQSAEPNIQYYDFQSGGDQYEKQPTTRIDYNLSSNHRLTGTYLWQKIVRDPDHLNGVDVRFPGLPNFRKYVSYRKLASGALRSSLGATLVNELRGGIKYGPSYFGTAEWNGPETFSASNGRALIWPNVGLTPTNYHTNFTPSQRSAWSWNLDDTVNWQKGSHSISFGGSYYDGHVWVTNQTMVQSVNFGVDSSDPANAMFNTTNFPGASSAQLGYARNLYAMLTGRVTQLAADARLDEKTNQYVLLGPRTQRLRQEEFGFFVSDSWRVNQRLTLNGGLRWDLQLPIEPTNNIMSTSTYEDLCGLSGIGADGKCNLFKPGVLAGRLPTFVQYDKGDPGYDTDYNNFAPSVGFAWRPGVETGFLRHLLGDPEQATLRAGFSIAYNREGMALFTGQIGGNPGSTIQANRNVALGNLVRPGENWPLLLREESRLAPPSIPNTVSYPIYGTVADDINIFDPNIEVSSARSYSVSFQRSLTKDMAFEIRYVGTRGRNIWVEEDYNEFNIQENDFLNEFKRAQANLQANIAAGKGNTFAYTGVPGTSPLPIYLAYFSRVPRDQAGDPGKYTSSNFSSSTFYNHLASRNPLPLTAAQALHDNATYRNNALAAGLPANFFIVNPSVDEAFMYTSNGFSKYDALQMEVRRRLSQGLQFSANYQYARSYGSRYLGLRYGRVYQENVSASAAALTGGFPTPTFRDVPRHAFKITWNYLIPYGRGQQWGSNISRLADAVLGGWEFHGSGRIQNRMLDFGNVNIVGMTPQELAKAYKVRFAKDADGVTTVWMLPEDIILNTRRAFNVSATSPNGYSALGVPEGRYLAPANGPSCIQLKPGDCAPLSLKVMSPVFTRFDMSFAKKFPVRRSMNFELRIDIMNIFDNVNFDAVAETGPDADINQVTAGYTDMSNTFDPGGRLGQIVIRFNW
ncbi:MAG: TonB-dependent receptor domain-containing protein [Vicinamibacterales bacterium]